MVSGNTTALTDPRADIISGSAVEFICIIVEEKHDIMVLLLLLLLLLLLSGYLHTSVPLFILSMHAGSLLRIYGNI